MKYSNKGFTLIELLVTIAIISLLASIVFASLSTTRERANKAKAQVQAKEIKKAIELGRLSRGSLPANIEPVPIREVVESGSPSELKSDIQEYYGGDVPDIPGTLSEDPDNDYVYLSDGDIATDSDGLVYVCGPGNPDIVQGDDSVIFYENKDTKWSLSQEDVDNGWDVNLWYEHPDLNNALYAIVDTPGGLGDIPDQPSFARTWGSAGPFDFSATRRVLTPLWSPYEEGVGYTTSDTFAFSCSK